MARAFLADVHVVLHPKLPDSRSLVTAILHDVDHVVVAILDVIFPIKGGHRVILAVLRNVQVVLVPTLQDLAVAPEKTDGVGFSILADVHHTALPFGYPQV